MMQKVQHTNHTDNLREAGQKHGFLMAEILGHCSDNEGSSQLSQKCKTIKVY